MIDNKTINEKYEVLKMVNKGGTSQVYLALDRNLNRQWAIKKIFKDNGNGKSAALMAEADIMKTLDHHALPRIVDIIEDTDCYYIIMDYVQGENLRTVLKSDGPQEQDTVVEWGIELCDVLAYLHSHNIVYRDMKPANVMLTVPDGNIKVIDFGIARQYKSYAREDTMPLGTEGYAAPEQYKGKGQTDARTDIYGLGVTMFQLLTGVNPAGYRDIMSIRKTNPALSSGLDYIIRKCTEEDPDKRYQSAEELKKALSNYKKFDEEYLLRKRKVVHRFYALLLTSGVCAMISLISFGIGVWQKNTQYDALLTGSPSRANIEKAISMKPGKANGYEILLDSYGETMDREETANFSEVYGKGKKSLSEEDRFSVCMDAGEKILTSYEEPQERAKLLTAYPYFYEVANSGEKSFEKYDAAVFYCALTDFYREFIMQEDSLVMKEAEKKDLQNLLDTMGTHMERMGDANNALKLSSYQIMASILYEEAGKFQAKGIEQKKCTALLDIMENGAKDITTDVPSLQKKKEEALLSIQTARQKVADAYIVKKEEAAPEGGDHAD